MSTILKTFKEKLVLFCFVLPKYIIVSEPPEDQKDFDASRDFVTNFFQFFHWKC